MTKKVRVENADTANYRVVVQTWQKGPDGEPDTLVETTELSNPAQLGEFTLWQGRYLVVKEA